MHLTPIPLFPTSLFSLFLGDFRDYSELKYHLPNCSCRPNNLTKSLKSPPLFYFISRTSHLIECPSTLSVLEELLGMVDEVWKPWLGCNEILNVVLKWHHTFQNLPCAVPVSNLSMLFGFILCCYCHIVSTAKIQGFPHSTHEGPEISMKTIWEAPNAWKLKTVQK